MSADENATGTIEPAAAQGRRLDPGARRNFLIIGAAVAVCVAVVVLIVLRAASGTTERAAPPSQVSLGTSDSERVDSVSPETAAKVASKQQQEAEEARRSGRSYVPPDNLGSVQPVTPAVSAGPSAYNVGSAAVTQHAQFNGEQDQRKREGLQRQLAALLGESVAGAGQGARQRVQFEGAQQQGQGAQVASRGQVAAAPAPAAGASGAQAAKREAVGSLTIHPAILTSDLMVAANNAQAFATAQITGGPAQGAFLVGSAKVVDENLEITFNQMRRNGKVYSISARALDEQTAGAAISGTVDRRLLQRYVMPIALAMAQGFYNAKAQTGSTITSIGGAGGATAAVSIPAPTTEQARSAGIAKGLEVVGQDVQKQTQMPILVTRERSYPVGVLFTAPVLEDQ
jgi:intracellular multiplication protein IcmE